MGTLKNTCRPVEEITKMTRFIKFTRQLWPQPPGNAQPHWCFANTLKFYVDEPEHKEVWSQDIPELLPAFARFKSMPCNFSVRYDAYWGWQLVIETDHEPAKMIWEEVFEKQKLFNKDVRS